MKLKQIIINGFKSFAEKVVVEFHGGITCIVGPNGCGKSNISDAIRWVLGEQSAKTMRGAKMPEMIFSGTATRKPKNLAEVTIIFSEVNQFLPVDYEEVEITRRLHRDGESEYLINRQPVRLKDIHQLLMNTGVGKTHFSMFEQGKIDQLIQFSPIERRAIIDEAAGITGFLESKAKTLVKLEETTINLNRLEDIWREILKQIESLLAQAEEARRYKEQKTLLEKLEKGILFARYQSIDKKREELSLKDQALYAQLNVSSRQNEERIAALDKGRQFAKEKASAYFRAKDVLVQKENDLRLLLQAKGHSKERLEELDKKRAQHAKEIEELKKQQKQRHEEIEGLKKQKENKFSETKLLKEELKQIEQQFQLLEKEVQTVRSKQLSLSQERLKAFQQSGDLQSEWKQIQARRDSYAERRALLVERNQALEQLKEQKREEFEENSHRYQEFQKELEQSKQAFTQVDEELRELQKRLEQESDKKSEQQDLLNNLKAREQALNQLKKEFVGFSAGGKKLLKAASEEQNPLFGLIKGLYEWITPDAVNSVAIKQYADTLIVEKVEELERVLKYAEKQKINDFSLLCVEAVCSDGKNFKTELENLFLKPFDSVENITEGYRQFQIHSKPSWIKEGFLLDEKGVLIVPGENANTLFSRESELKSLLKQIKQEQEAALQVEENIKQLKEQSLALQNLRKLKDQAHRKLEMQGVEINFTVQKIKGENERLLKEIKQVQEEIQQLTEVFVKLQGKEEEVLATLRKAQASLESMQKSLEENQQAALGSDHKFLVKKQELEEKRARSNLIESEYNKVSYDLNLMEAKDQETARLLDRLQKELFTSSENEKSLSNKSVTIEQDIETVQKLLEKTGSQVNQFQKNKEEAEQSLREFEKQAQTAQQNLHEIETKNNQIKVQCAQVESSLKAMEEELNERYQLTVAEFLENREPLTQSIEAAEKELRAIKHYMETHAAVNLAAIEDCEKQQIRAIELENQIKDLKESKEELLKLIQTLEKESRDIFNVTFQKIRENFQKNFQILFSGGVADLQLDHAQDVLLSGIEITAKPPGKQMRSLSLLSGGEKCLTVMALLFAIFEVKAAPFCVLDEIDAPLDESNVERFLNVVRHFSDRSQFIIVTHNKRTMSLADSLFGVSMEERGVSKLLSIEFSKEQKKHEMALV